MQPSTTMTQECLCSHATRDEAGRGYRRQALAATPIPALPHCGRLPPPASSFPLVMSGHYPGSRCLLTRVRCTNDAHA